MRRTLKATLSAMLVSFSLTQFSVNSSSESLPRYDCKTIKFRGTGDDDNDFIAKNERKLFTILDNGKSLIVTMSSKEFESSTSIYHVLARNDDGVQAYQSGSLFMETMYLGFYSVGAHGGTYEASLNVLSSFFSNTWLLSCEKAP